MTMQRVTSLPREAVQAQLARIVDSRHFRNAPRLSRFLTYVVEQSLAGQAERLKGYTIGLEVFDKGADFDPQTDTIVRVQARALRHKLDAYHAQDGAQDPVQISIAKGGYEPTFLVPRTAPEDPLQAPAQAPLPAAALKPSIAVLPFELLSADTDAEILSHSLTEGTISSLSRFKDLSVFSRSTTERAKRDHLSIAQIYDLFQPDFVLEGSFRLRANRMETRIKLIDAAHDEVIMSDRIRMQKDPGDFDELQDEMADRIAARIAVEYGPVGHFARQAVRARSSAKWETYAWISRYFETGFQMDQATRDEIEAGLSAAVAQDPDSSQAHAVLAMIHIEQYRALTAHVGNPAALEQAMKHADLAVQADAMNAMAHQSRALAYFHARRFVDFRVSVRRALLLNPGHSDMLAMFGICFVRLGEWAEAIRLLDRAAALSPLHPSWHHLPKAMALMMTQGPDAAIAELEKGPMPDSFAFHFPLLWFHVEAGDMDAARIEKARLLAVAPDVEALARRYFEAICLKRDIADRAIAAARLVGLNIAE